jgi:PBP1b-binding outer membrane lipoprotein LpoB
MKKKKVVLVLTILAVALVFAGCGDGDDSDTSEPVITSIDAAPDFITLPGSTTSVTLTAAATSADGSDVKAYNWTVKEKPAAAAPAIATPAAASTDVTALTVAGTYKFQIEVTGNNNVKKTCEVTVIAALDATVSFGSLGTLPDTTINFAPSAALPPGVTYRVTDNRPTPHTWNSANGFNGQVAIAGNYDGLEDTNVTFSQTFYLNGVKITGAGSERTVVINVDNFPSERFMSVVGDPIASSVTLKWGQ